MCRKSSRDFVCCRRGSIRRLAPPSRPGRPPRPHSHGTDNSLLFYTGHDPKHPDLLQAEALVNRGFAFTADGADNCWQWNSTSGTSIVADALQTLGIWTKPSHAPGWAVPARIGCLSALGRNSMWASRKTISETPAPTRAVPTCALQP